MKRIIVDMSKGELDFIREALEVKHINLMSYFDMCEENANPEQTWGDIRGLSESELDEELAMFSTPKKKPFTYKRKAPYGVKKDGTPKAKPGRKL